MNFRWIALSIALSAAASAQTASAPALGWTLADDGQSIQRILGVPGAARLAPAVRLPDELTGLVINPSASFAIALQGSERTPVLLDLEDLTRRTALANAPPGPEEAIWSPSGSAVALRYPDAAQIKVYTFARGALEFKADVSAVGRVAISDDGAAVLVLNESGLALYHGADAAVLTPSPSARFTFLARTQVPAFWAEGQLRIGDQMRDLPLGDGEELFLSSPGEGRLVAVRSAAGEMMTFDAAGQLLEQTSGPDRCNCRVNGLEGFGRTGAVRFRTADGGPLWVADSFRVFFVVRGE